MAATWTWFLADAGGNALAELTTASGRSLTFKRNNYAEAACTISHADDAASLLFGALANTGIPTLRCYRRGPNDTHGTLRFNGFLAPFSENLDENAGSLSLVFRSPFARLCSDGVGSGRFTDEAIDCVGQDAGQVASSLIKLYGGAGTVGATDPTFAIPYAETSFAGLGIGTIATTVPRDESYQFAAAGDEIVKLSALLDGFDFDETFLEGGTTLANFNVYASQGAVNSTARFEYGPQTLNNVRAVERTTAPPINAVRLLGANGLTSYQEDAGSIATYGRWYSQQSQSDVDEQSTLDQRAKALLRSAPVKTLKFTPELALDSCPKPWDDFWLGDTCPFFGRMNAFSENLQARVNAITVAISDDGFESADIPDPQAMSREDRESRHDLLHSSVTVEAMA